MAYKIMRANKIKIIIVERYRFDSKIGCADIGRQLIANVNAKQLIGIKRIFWPQPATQIQALSHGNGFRLMHRQFFMPGFMVHVHIGSF